MHKFSLMTRETILRRMRAYSRQRRACKRYFEDLCILIGEANYTDDHMQNKEEDTTYTAQTTPALTSTISLVVDAILQYINVGFPLELYSSYELSMIYFYLNQVWNILQSNRKIMITSFVSDLHKKSQI